MPGNSGVERNTSTSIFHCRSRKITSGLAVMELLEGAYSVEQIAQWNLVNCKYLFINHL